MTKQTKVLLGLSAAALVGFLLYNRKENKPKMAAAVMPASSSANFLPPEYYIVGGYDASNNTTYIYPEGNMGGGVRISGRLNIIQGSRFRYNGVVS